MAAAALALHSLAGHAENAQLTRSEPLRTQPSVAANTIMDVARRTEVQVLETRHGWTRVEATGGRTGWLRDASLDRNTATLPVTGSGQRLSSPTSGSSLPRRLPRASQHGLILTIGSVAGSPPAMLEGGPEDGRLGAEIARLSGVPDANLHYRTDAGLNREGLRQAFAELDARMGNGDQALIYLSAFGIRRQDHGRCAEAILTHDREAFPFDELLRHLQVLAGKADKVFLILDVGRGDSASGTPAVSSRFARALSDPGCKGAQPGAEFGRLPANVLVLAASRPNENAGGTPAGGLFSQALHACLSGAPSSPASPSGLPTGEALIACSRQLIAAGPGSQHPSLAGNGELVPTLHIADQAARDARQVLRVIHAQRDQRRRIELTRLSGPPGTTRLRISSSEPGYVYILTAGRSDFRLLYPSLTGQQMPIQRTADIEIPLTPEKEGEWLIVVSDAIRSPGRAGFTADGPSVILHADSAGAGEITQEFLSGDGSRNCLFSETRNLGPSQALACSSRFGSSVLGTAHSK